MAEFYRLEQYTPSRDEQLEDHFHENVMKDHDMGFRYQLDDGEVFWGIQLCPSLAAEIDRERFQAAWLEDNHLMLGADEVDYWGEHSLECHECIPLRPIPEFNPMWREYLMTMEGDH